jgi:AAA+ ATPase superfamily predicted ATPase
LPFLLFQYNNYVFLRNVFIRNNLYMFDNMENPFEYQRIVVGKTFVDREEEIKILTKALLSGENMLLYSPRRLGKSSLLQEVLLRIDDQRIAIYVDLWECLTEVEIAEKLATGIINAAFTKMEKAAAALKEVITSTRPLMTLEPDGSIGLKLEYIEKDKTLKETLYLIEKIAEKRKKKVIIVIDECQVIAEFEGHRIEKLFRTVIQQQRLATYVFSGSKQHVLKAMVNQKTRPFYRQLRPMTLGPIPLISFAPFIKKGFSKIARIDDRAIEEIYRFTGGNPQRTQQVCHFLFVQVQDGKKPTSEQVKKVVTDLCLTLDKEFEDELDSIKNKRQRAILKALALDSTEKPLSADFIKKHTLGPSSSVQTALKMLIEKGVLNEHYHFIDPLFENWIIFKHNKIIR